MELAAVYGPRCARRSPDPTRTAPPTRRPLQAHAASLADRPSAQHRPHTSSMLYGSGQWAAGSCFVRPSESGDSELRAASFFCGAPCSLTLPAPVPSLAHPPTKKSLHSACAAASSLPIPSTLCSPYSYGKDMIHSSVSEASATARSTGTAAPAPQTRNAHGLGLRPV